MPKKKGGKKKKKGSKKASSASAEPKLSQMERFVRFSVETRSEQITSWRQERDEMRHNNVMLREQLDALKQKQQQTVTKLREKSFGTAHELTQYEQELQQRIEDALGEKQEFVKTEEKSIVDMRRKLKETEQRIIDENQALQSLQVFQVFGQQENMKAIEDLETVITEMKQGHEEELADMGKRFQFARERFSANFDARVERTRELATENAINIQSSRDKVAAAEREWLKRELETHRLEKQRLQSICDDLEKENLKLLATLYAEGADTSKWRAANALKHLAGGAEDEEEDDEEEEEEDDLMLSDDDDDENMTGAEHSEGQWHISTRGDPVFVRHEVSTVELFKEDQSRRVQQLKTFSQLPVQIAAPNRTTPAKRVLPEIRSTGNAPSPRVQAVLAETSKTMHSPPVKSTRARRWGPQMSAASSLHATLRGSAGMFTRRSYQQQQQQQQHYKGVTSPSPHQLPPLSRSAQHQHAIPK
ncbi:hypothetical protein PTSG_12206 [Salpingoeca rosetta]|uniref:Uncharacterized protein n=1 Tax=Salpingoeca rosetta (strain ATCC 50818 / BSB-021) TaxID=946362 RepID=F2U9G5_SALR5|nr:uncharacterized protein PTSG_12206 [Salpingoeca rosetta]EGD72992.1 hypothetical protein PTSG_12206 [Salpingoeca rosetta]|eukprot:XP_004994023.1 hypothetical protein PTSG_12206 [Salpingoeca rosetta]